MSTPTKLQLDRAHLQQLLRQMQRIRRFEARCVQLYQEQKIRGFLHLYDGELGPVYGVQWRSWPKPDGGHIDQIAEVIQTLKTNPDSRRIMVSAWNVADLDQMALMPCHAFYSLWVGTRRFKRCPLSAFRNGDCGGAASDCGWR